MDRPTLNDIFRRHGEVYRSLHPNMTLNEKKVMRSIELCRTEDLGGRVEACDTCGHTMALYNSCRNRHCPQCQSMKKEQWILERSAEILPFVYFHVVFTLPDALSGIVYHNKRAVFDLLFRACKETLLSASAQEKYFGADIGFFAILHTWGQKMNLHPHLHCVVPGGGFSQPKQKWIHAPHNYLVPVQVLKMRFRSLFLQGLKRLHAAGALHLAGTKVDDPAAFQNLIDVLFATEWVVYLKESFQTSGNVIQYLGRYTHKIAISNHRIISEENGIVTFTYRDYKDGNKKKLMRMDVYSFMRRFMLHVVPCRFVRIRYYGILAHRNKQKAIRACREFFHVQNPDTQKTFSWQDILLKKTGRDCTRCPVCKEGRLYIKERIVPIRYRAPPGNSGRDKFAFFQ